ncbi:hypothetical protein AVEN_126194-1 [Araneus ventricosus]|uniref:Uncharacterized protein n=1 Tax=Araneus ventricosus TaxID=182803 RepID=A0A4Y2LC83_ARAVE|nr:hypothetical protein AVEN_75764-1 [Araneus ventricosus]GBN12265.1 hypothetical protein AVEN_126194-1 [Araneus ventricosus]
MWPDGKIVHCRPRYPESLGSVERCVQDIEIMLRAWMDGNGSTDLVTGCRCVQWQKIPHQNTEEGGENQVANLEQDICYICSRNLNETSFVSCYLCSMNIHITCYQIVSSTSEDNNFNYHKKIVIEHQKAHKGRKEQRKE